MCNTNLVLLKNRSRRLFRIRGEEIKKNMKLIHLTQKQN